MFQGVTLLECIITLSLIALLLMFSIGFDRSFISRQQAQTDLEQLMMVIAYARSQAIYTNTPVIICHSDNQKTCDGSWSQGYIAFWDRDGSHQPSVNNKLFQIVTALKRDAQLTWVGFRGQNLQIEPTGILAAASGHFAYCPTANADRNGRRLVINRTGRMRIAGLQTGDC